MEMICQDHIAMHCDVIRLGSAVKRAQERVKILRIPAYRLAMGPALQHMVQVPCNR